MSQVIELTVRNWDEVYEDLSKRLKVKPKAGVELSKHLKMAGKQSSPLLAQIFRGLYFQECSQKWKPLSKKDKGRRLKTYIRCPRFSLRLLTQVLECFKKKWLSLKTLICLYQREMSKGRRRRKRKCRRMFSQSEGKIGATEDTLLSGYLWYGN